MKFVSKFCQFLICFCVISAISFGQLIVNRPFMLKSQTGELYLDLKGYNNPLVDYKDTNYFLSKKDNVSKKGYQGIDRIFTLENEEKGMKILSFINSSDNGLVNVKGELKASLAQNMRFLNAENGYNFIMDAKTGKFLTSNGEGNKVTFEDKTKKNNQKWKVEYIQPNKIAPLNNKSKFSMRPALSKSLYSIDVPGAAPNQKNNEALKIWKHEEAPDRYFANYAVKKNSDYFRIQPLHATYVFEMKKDSTKTQAKNTLKNTLKVVKGKNTKATNTVKLKLSKKNSNPGQQFKIVSTGEPHSYYFINKASGKYLTANTNDKVENGTEIMEYEFLKGNLNQKWVLRFIPEFATPSENRKFYIKAAYADKYFDLPGDGKKTNADGLKFMLWNLNNGGNDKTFRFLSSGENIWRNIEVQNGGRLMTVPGNLKENGTPIILNKRTGENNQKFAIYPTSRTTFVLRARNWKTLDVNKAKFENGTKISLYDNNFSIAQQFQLINADGSRAGKVTRF